jgi:hypothetical protein
MAPSRALIVLIPYIVQAKIQEAETPRGNEAMVNANNSRQTLSRVPHLRHSGLPSHVMLVLKPCKLFLERDDGEIQRVLRAKHLDWPSDWLLRIQLASFSWLLRRAAPPTPHMCSRVTDPGAGRR